MCVNSSTAVLLQTAQAYIGQPGGSGHKVKARIVFDSCSQRTYVTQRLKDSLHLHPVASDKLKITAFGDEEPTQREYERVQFSIKAIDGMELYAKGMLFQPSATQYVVKPLRQLSRNILTFKGCAWQRNPIPATKFKSMFYWELAIIGTLSPTLSGEETVLDQ